MAPRQWKSSVVDRQRDHRDDGAGDHGHKGVAGGVEGARVDGLRRPEKQRDGEDGEVGRAQARIVRREAAAGKDQVDGRPAERHHDRGGEQAERGHARDRVGDAGGELEAAIARPQAGEEGHGGGAGGLGQHGHGRGEELLGVAHQRDRAADVRCEVGDDPVVGGDQRDAGHERQREAHPFAQSLVVPVENEAVARAGAVGKEPVEKKRARNTRPPPCRWPARKRPSS